jgi:hypothetical protein
MHIVTNEPEQFAAFQPLSVDESFFVSGGSQRDG